MEQNKDLYHLYMCFLKKGDKWSFKIFNGFNFQKKKMKSIFISITWYKFIRNLLITSTFRIYLFRSTRPNGTRHRSDTESISKGDLRQSKSKEGKEKKMVIPNPKLTYTLSKGRPLVLVPTNPFSQFPLIISLTKSWPFPPRERFGSL